MQGHAFDHAQMTAIGLAAERVAAEMGASKEKDRLILARAVFDIAAETGTFDPEVLVGMARERLTPNLGWRFG